MLSFGALGPTKDQMMAGLKYPADFSSDDVERNCEILNGNVRESAFLKMGKKRQWGYFSTNLHKFVDT